MWLTENDAWKGSLFHIPFYWFQATGKKLKLHYRKAVAHTEKYFTYIKRQYNISNRQYEEDYKAPCLEKISHKKAH